MQVYYNNQNLDTLREYYPNGMSTWNFDDQLNTLDSVRQKVWKCVVLVLTVKVKTPKTLLVYYIKLKTLPLQTESLPINMLVQMEDTPWLKSKSWMWLSGFVLFYDASYYPKQLQSIIGRAWVIIWLRPGTRIYGMSKYVL